MTETTAAGPGPRLACVVLAHTDPTHLRRLIDALDPFPVFLHCDRSTPEPVFEAMVRDLPQRVVVQPRLATGWARWENVDAEVAGYRAALEQTDATHIALLTGTDYPVASGAAIDALLAGHPGRTFVVYHPLPYAQWGRRGGLDRLRYRHWAYRKRMLRLPVPRRIPDGIRFAGGSQLKVLARHHAAKVVDVADNHPELVRFFRRSWVADETFVASVLSTPRFVPAWPEENVPASLWYIGWDGSRRKSPPWLGIDDLPALGNLVRSTDCLVPPIFARKFSTGHDTEVLDAIDEQLRRRDRPNQ